MTESVPRMRVLSRSECLVLLAGSRVGRVGLSIGALPAIFPVNFVLLDDKILFRTSQGTKLAAATSHHVVAFEVDGFEADGSAGWSVLVRGTSAEVTDPRTLADAWSSPLVAWAMDGRADHYVVIPTEDISGRRFENISPAA